MIDKEQDIEKLAEDLLTAYGKELCRSHDVYLNALEDESVPDPPFFAVPPRKKASVKRKVRRVVILVAVLILTMGLVVISSEAVKEKMFNYFMDEKDGHTDLLFMEGEEDQGGIPAFELSYVPEGYKLVEDDSDILERALVFANDAELYIHFTVSRSEDYDMSIDNDTLKRKEITVNDKQAYLFYDESNSAVIWQIGDYTLDLFTGLSQEEVMKVAKNVILKK